LSGVTRNHTSAKDARKEKRKKLLRTKFVRLRLRKPPLTVPQQQHHQEEEEGTTAVGTTQLGELTRSFEDVLSNNEVDTVKLMQACHKLVETTRKTGQTGNARDMENNIHKVEALYNSAPPHRRQSMSALLEFEREMGIHGPNAELLDPSAAVGFLWIRRSIAFQSEMYKNVLNDPQKEPRLAALDAYKNQVEPYHNWAIQKLFRASFSSMTPPRKDMLTKLGGFQEEEFGDEEEQATLQDLNQLLNVWQPILVQWHRTFEELDLEDTRRV